MEHRLIRVRGVVQGVGYRPFVHRLALSLGVRGAVRNDTEGVLVDAHAPAEVLDEFTARLTSDAPPLARVESVAAGSGVGCPPADGFRIERSRDTAAEVVASLPPDVAVCDDCLAEMRDPSDRRFRHPFVTCTNCGPRFTITTGLPYDRPNTTMAPFAMCDACRAEYGDPADRRYHAQPLCCPACGPRLAPGAFDTAVRTLHDGGIVAVKGIGGYHLMCDATNASAVHRLRHRKRRGDKPFAIMVAHLGLLDGIASASVPEAAALASPQRPIVLLRKQARDGWAEHAAPGAAEVGVMLPNAPLHHLLADEVPVMVCTSGNVADEPIVTDDADAMDRLAGLADAWLAHDRPIHTPCDDSVVRVVRGAAVPVRRSRGYVPLPVHLGPAGGLAPVLAMGGDLKGTVCVAAGDEAWMSQHLGDHGELATYRAAHRAARQLLDLVRVTPVVVAVDAHPAYLSSRLGREIAADLGVPVVEVQHHHAHLAALLAEHGHPGPAVGFAFDGTGYGPDGTIWGGEVLVGDAAAVRRAAHLRPVRLAGGDAAVEHPERAAEAHLRAAALCDAPPHPAPAVLTSSMGRLFDAIASIAGVRHHVDYEAQAAIELQAAADPSAEGSYWFPDPDGTGAIDPAPVVTAAAADVAAGLPAGVVSTRFHRAVVDLVVRTAYRLRDHLGVHTVALTGGVFQNALLLDGCIDALDAAGGFEVLWHRQVPTNDGGLALGQAAVAGRRR